MILLRFTLRNHASFRGEASLSFVSSALKTNVPRSGNWADYVTPVAAIYGANASGKSVLLDGLRYMQAIIANSATSWSGQARLPRAPFRLDDSAATEPSRYVLEFVADDGLRYEYGLALTEERIVEEWLLGYWTAKPTMLFDRTPAGREVGRRLKGGSALLDRITGERELVLSRGVTAKNGLLTSIADAITSKLDFASFGDLDRGERLDRLATQLAEGAISTDELVTLLRVADIGISDVEVQEHEIPAGLRRVMKIFVTEARAEDVDSSMRKEAALNDEEIDELVPTLRRALRFHHVGAGGHSHPLDLVVESSGTLTWLGLAVPALERLREGGLLCVDELDASLHPQLAQVLVAMFTDKEVNKRGAQLLFTTHDTNFIDADNPDRLSPEQVWFTQKDSTGVSELFSLLEFPTRADQNFAHRYLAGRYGALPRLVPSQLRGLVGEQEPLPLEMAL